MYGARIRSERALAGLTQAELASVLSVSANTVSRIEAESSEPGAELICHMANYFRCSSDYLLGRSETRTKD